MGHFQTEFTTERRQQSRLEIKSPARICGRESEGCEWAELTHFINANQVGARFALQRPTEPGRLLQIISSLPEPLRCFDFQETQYKVWALVTNVRYGSQNHSDSAFPVEVGVAFTGARAPRGYETKPCQLYELAAKPSGLTLWQVRPKKVQEPESLLFRAETRHPIALEVEIQTFGARNIKPLSEKTVTENLSRQGASVFTLSDIEVGRFVRVTSSRHLISRIAAVRARRAGEDGRTRLHLEFTSGGWPLEGVE